MKKFGLAVWLVALVFAGAAPAAEIEGILMDKMCSARIAKEGMKVATEHSLECAVMEDCVASGFGVVTAGGKFIPFDSEGSKKAEKALQTSKRVDNIRVKVSGEQSGETFRVKTLTLL